MKKWLSAAFAAAVLLTGCSAASDEGHQEPTADHKEQEDQKDQDTQKDEKTSNSEKTSGSETDKVDKQAILTVDEVLESPDSFIGKQITVRGETPQTIIEEDADGNGISLLYQEGSAGDTDHAIRFIVPKDAPGASVIEVSGTLNQGSDGYILEETTLAQ